MLSEREEYLLQSNAKKELPNDLRRESIHLAETGKESIGECFPDVGDIN
jgi:hypothetical protein